MAVVPPPVQLPGGQTGSNPYSAEQQAQREAEEVLKKQGIDSIADAIKIEQGSRAGPVAPSPALRAQQVRILAEREGQVKERKRVIRGAEEAGIDVEDWVALRRFIRPDREIKDTSWAKDACALVCNSIRRKGKGKGKNAEEERPPSEDEGISWRAEIAEPQPSYRLASVGAAKGLGKGMHPPAYNKWFGIDDGDDIDNRSDLTGTLDMRGVIPEGCPQPSDPNEPDIGKLDDVLELLEEPFTPMVQLPVGKLKVVARLNNIDLKNCVEKAEILNQLTINGMDDEKAHESLNMCPELVEDLAEQIRVESHNQGMPEQVPEQPVKKKKKWKPAFGVSVFQKGHEIDPSAALAVAGLGGITEGFDAPEPAGSPGPSGEPTDFMGGAFPVGLTPQEAAAHVQAAAKVAAEMFLSGQAAVPGGVGHGTGVVLPGSSSPSYGTANASGYGGVVIPPVKQRTDAECTERKGKPARVMAEYYK